MESQNGVHLHYCGCDIQIHSVVDVSDESDVPVISDEQATAWEALYVPSVDTRKDPNQAPTEVAPSPHATQEVVGWSTLGFQSVSSERLERRAYAH